MLWPDIVSNIGEGFLIVLSAKVHIFFSSWFSSFSFSCFKFYDSIPDSCMLWLKFYSIILHIYFYGYCWNRAIDWHTSNLNTVINLRVIQQPTVNFYLWQDSVVRWGTEATSIFPKYFNSFRYDTWEALFWLFFMEIFIGTYHKKKYVLLNSSFIHSSFFPDDDIDLTRYVYLIREGIVLYSQDIRFTVYKFFLGIFFRFDITCLITR